ncbi:hypothetical protein KAZ92_02290 [Candidatus Gracilibacteria bacterium]|nr:hypothetical protein [Candidatus Gracilibacteria bacterium]
MLRKIIASLIFTIFVVASVPFFLGLTMGRTFFSRSFYQGALFDAAYSPLSDYVAENIQLIDPVFARFTQDEIRAHFVKHFTPDVLRKVIDQSLDQFDQRITSTTPDTAKKSLKIPINLSSLVPVSKEFLKEFSSEIKLRGDSQDFYQDKLITQFAGTKGDFSYELDLGMSKSSYVSTAKTLDTMAYYISTVLFAFTLLMLLLWFKVWDTGLRWAGSMWMTSAVLGGFIALFIAISEKFLSPNFFGLPQDSAQYVHVIAVFHVIAFSFLKSYLFVLFAAFIIGLAFFLFARRLDRAIDA